MHWMSLACLHKSISSHMHFSLSARAAAYGMAHAMALDSMYEHGMDSRGVWYPYGVHVGHDMALKARHGALT